MRKTFLKVALIGLLVGSLPVGFTSCKDYDDDINNLQNEQNSLKTQLSTVESSISSLQTAVSAAQSAADAAKAAAATAQSAAEKAEAEGKAAAAQAEANAIKAAKEDLEALKAELQKQIADNANGVAVNAEAIKENAAAIAKINGKIETLEALTGKLTSNQEEMAANLKTLTEALETAKDALATQLTDLNAKVADNASKIGSLEAALEAQTAALDAYKEANGTDVAAINEEITALKAQIKALSESGYDDTAIKAEIEAVKTLAGELSGKIDAINTQLNTIESGLRVINGLITHLGLVSDTSFGDGNTSLSLFNPVTPVKTITFGKGMKGEFTITKGENITFEDSILVKVSPAGAVLTAEDLLLVNSAKEEITDYVKITEVKKYEGKLTSRAFAENGLYVVKFGLTGKFDDATQKAFNAAVTANKKPVLFALGVNDSANEDERAILSEYGITVYNDDVQPTYELKYNAKNTSVNEIHNRWMYAEDHSSFMYRNVANAATNMDAVYDAAGRQNNYDAAIYENYFPVGDYAWNTKTMVATLSGSAKQPGSGDNRTNKDFLRVDVGTEFPVELIGIDEAENPIAGFYVTIDDLRATESNGSEFEAWNAYAKNIEGLNEVVTDANDLKLTIKSEANVPNGDVIGFRVWAVNYNGELVDPDGRAFYVIVNDENAIPVETGAINAVITANANTANLYTNITSGVELGDWINDYNSIRVEFAMNVPSNKVTMNQSNKFSISLNGTAALTSTMVQDGNANNSWAGSFMLAGGGQNLNNYMHQGTPGTASYVVWNEYSLSARPNKNQVRQWSDLFSNIKVSISTNMIVDGQTYYGTLTIKDPSTLRVLQTISVTVKKTVPTTIPDTMLKPNAATMQNGSIYVYVNNQANDGVEFLLDSYLTFGKYNGQQLNANSFGAALLTQGYKPADNLVDPDTEEYYTVGRGMNFMLEGWKKGEGLDMFYMTGDFYYGYDGRIASAFAEATDPTVQIPTMPFVNDGKAHDVVFTYNYGLVSYRQASNGNYYSYYAPAYRWETVVINSIPNNYTMSWNTELIPNKVEVDYGKKMYINADAIDVNSPLAASHIRGWSLANAMTSNPNWDFTRYYINPAKTTFKFTDGIDKYAKITYIPNGSSIGNLSCDVKTGVVTVASTGEVVVGAQVAKDANGNWICTKAPSAVIAINPIITTGTATGSVNCNLQISYIDYSGVGRGYNYTTGQVLPTLKNLPVQFNF